MHLGGKWPLQKIYVLGFSHPVMGSPFQVHERTMLLWGREYEEGRVVALNTMFVKYIETICFDIFWFVKELYIKLLYVVCLQEKYKEMSHCEWDLPAWTSDHPTPTNIPRVDGLSTGPLGWGVTAWYQILG